MTDDGLAHGGPAGPEDQALGHSAIYTVGHSNGSLTRLLDLLHGQRIRAVADVRSIPYSHYLPQFNSGELARRINEAGLTYVQMGSALGGRPSQVGCYDPAGHVIYDRLEETLPYRMGIQELQSYADRQRTCLLCSEEDPLKCHRFLSIGHVLNGAGRSVLHIRGDGSIHNQELLEAQVFVCRPHQYSFFEEAPQRKSLQRVSPASQQNNFSKS